ncbi:MAG: butyrate kinase, partial [Candidatus Izimaplasma sp.]|nr:butyrate kinase [Candidatus Izimaplasma bacterium]
KSGIYEVNSQMIKDLSSNKYGTHASNLGGLIVYELAKSVNKKAYIADPVVVDEMSSVAKISGLNGISRRPLWHALNQKAVAKRYAEKLGFKYEDMNLIVAHLGGGISVGLHKRGRVTDVNNALDGDGPFSPERTGGLPVAAVYELAMSGQYTLEQFQKLNHGFGGLVSYLNTSDAEEVAEMISNGQVMAKRIMKAMVYQIAKEIGSLYAVTRGNLDAIIITGGLAYNQAVLQPLLEYLDHLGEIVVYPGEDELEALAYNMHQLLTKQIELKIYK